MAVELTKQLTSNNVQSFFHKDYSEVAKSDPTATTIIFRQEANRRYDTLTVTETSDLFNRVVDVNKPKRCYELACCFTVLAIAAGVAGLFCPPLFFAAAGFLFAAMISGYEGMNAKKENIQLVDQYVRGLVHKDRRERNEMGVSSELQTHRRLHENTMVKLGQECLTQLGNQTETLTSREIADKLEELKGHFNELSSAQKDLIGAFVSGKLDPQSGDPIQTIVDTIRADRTSIKANAALQFGALAIISLSKYQPISSVLENKPIPSRYDNLRESLGVTINEEAGSEIPRFNQGKIELSVRDQDIALTDRNGQTTQLKASRVFTISAPDRQGHVRVNVRRVFREVEIESQ